MPDNQDRLLKENTFLIILAAGKGARMGNEGEAKVCFPINKVPAINRTIAVFKKQNFKKFLVVVGSNAEQVMETVTSGHPEVMFVLQNPQLGTGHAAKIASTALRAIKHSGPVMLTMGDKYIEGAAIEMLVRGFKDSDADLTLLSIPKNEKTQVAGGRIVSGANNRVLGIIESIDLARQSVADELKKFLLNRKKITPGDIRDLIKIHFSNPGKISKAVPELQELAAKNEETIEKNTLTEILSQEKYCLKIAGKTFTARQVEQNSSGVSPSLFLFNATAFYAGVNMIKNDNAQEEYYLTDIVELLANYRDNDDNHPYHVEMVAATDADLIQGFNTPDELLAIQGYIRHKQEIRSHIR